MDPSVLKRAAYMFLGIIQYLIIARIILSWVSSGRNSGIYKFIYEVTEPLLAPIRKLLQDSPFGGAGMMLDLSPAILVLLISLLQNFFR